ncbi:SNF2-family ATP dependent chromatin remodeling factor snf21 [Coprinopsis cinerea AmutBmut pab1-1]|nr:SNF2-family ATP dependent chromatin remodeling factor snf21 [Coprinopsis cinerea AmutBmut pab1-1]
MPPYSSLVPAKRRNDDDVDGPNRKRPSLDAEPSYGNTRKQYWMIQWRNPQARKHKTWEGDGVLVGEPGGRGTLYDSEGKIIATGKVDSNLSEGTNFHIGGKDIELDRAITQGEYFSGACFGRGTSAFTAQQTVPAVPVRKQAKFIPPQRAANISSSSTDALTTGNKSNIPPNSEKEVVPSKCHWAVNWRKQQTRKHKTWDGDGFVSLMGDQLRMVTEDGKLMGTTKWKGGELYSGLRVFINNKEVELDRDVPSSQVPKAKGQPLSQEEDLITEPSPPPTIAKPSTGIAASSFYGAPKAKQPKGPLHDPNAPGAVVFKAPNKAHMQRYNKYDLPVVPVVLDPILARRMRPHQIEGVSFMYECVMGLRKHEGNGCILADEMGLGKTLQTIALVWTLLKQNPYSGAGPIAKKALIVCPVSLITNWKAEFHKWLGRDRVGITVVDKEKVNIDAFFYNKTQHVLIIGYERLRTVINKVSTSVPPIDLIICDEGHRLKSANNKTTAMFKALRTRRRIILSGTPIQNDLSEFHAMTEFCNPGLLDEYPVFKRVYETPILKSRAPEATAKEIEVGEARTESLLQVANSFVLRRDATLLKKHLPPKHEYVVFVTPTRLQISMFSAILRPERIDDLASGSTAESLALINILTKISNSPILLKATADSYKARTGDKESSCLERAGVKEALRLMPEGAQVSDMTLSGKLIVLAKMLKDIRNNTEEKCVVVSHFTSTLNILEAFCQQAGYSFYRLDGQTPQQKRQEYVNAFNKSSQRGGFVFLLSSKAGGVGINLIGGSRLFLIDSDWNPSHDLQAMARCHRDGQKRPVFIYRLVTAGTIDEKIFQRQITKLGLSASLIGSADGSASKSDSFSKKDLRDIFRIDPNTSCNTHDLLECPCDGSVIPVPGSSSTDDNGERVARLKRGFQSASSVTMAEVDEEFLDKKKAGLASLSEWKHINCLKPSADRPALDEVIQAVLPECDSGFKSYDSITGSSRAERLLKAVDLDNIQAMEKTFNVADFPGGTISFLFEKSTESTIASEGSDVEA